jgi:fructose-bisphosphate aldolase class II
MEAQVNGYAVGAFNTVNLETTWAILEAAADRRSPVIIQMTEKTFQYGGDCLVGGCFGVTAWG